jgi:hypothetical protein
VSGPPDDIGRIGAALQGLTGNGAGSDPGETFWQRLAQRGGEEVEMNVTHWELFTLRDADSHHRDTFGHFGVLRDDYTPKPAHAVLCELFTRGGRP